MRQLGGVPDRRHHRPDRRCLLLDRGWGKAYFALMVLGCVAVGAVAWPCERQVPTTANGVPVEEPVPD